MGAFAGPGFGPGINRPVLAIVPSQIAGLPWEVLRRGFASYLNHTGTIASRAISENPVKIGIVSKAAKVASTFTSLYARTLSYIFIEQVQLETIAKAYKIINSVAGYHARGYYRHGLSKRLRKRAGRKLDYE